MSAARRLKRQKKETTSFEESKLVFDEIFKDIDIEGDKDVLGISSVFSILELPDKEFNFMKELTLIEMEKSLNNIEDKILMLNALEASGTKIEDFVVLFENLCSSLEEKFKDIYSKPKIDFLKRFFGLVVNAIQSVKGVASRIVSVPFELCRENAKQPKYAFAGDAGMDIYACEDYTIKPGETVIIPTGIKTALPVGYELQVRPRSGQSVKTKLRVANTPGTIDANYRDEIGVIIENIEPKITDITTENVLKEDGSIDYLKVTSLEYGKDYVIEKGQRFAQFVLSEKPMCSFYEVEDVKEIGADRASGFGGSGKF